MKTKVQEKEKAIFLRHKGYSYNDILKKIPVAKSTLSNWLKNLPLTEDEKDALKHRKNSNISRGRIKAATALRSRRVEREKLLFKETRDEFQIFIKDPLFPVGIALYWAEGAKRSVNGFYFSNSDPEMISLMLLWLEQFLLQQREKIKVRLYVHKPYANENCEKFWSEHIRIPIVNFQKTIYKPTGLLVKKRPNYKGCLRIEVCKKQFLMKMLFWQQLLISYYKKEK